MDSCLWILVFIFNLSTIQLVAIEEHDRVKLRTRDTEVEMNVTPVSPRTNVMEQTHKPLNKDNYGVPVNYTSVPKIEVKHEEISHDVKTDSTSQTINNISQYLDVFKMPFNKPSPPDLKFFGEMRENPAMTFWNECYHMKNPEPVKSFFAMKLLGVTENDKNKSQYHYNDNVTLQASPTFLPKLPQEKEHSYFVDGRKDTTRKVNTLDRNRIHKRVIVKIRRPREASYKNVKSKDIIDDEYNQTTSKVRRKNKLLMPHPKDNTSIADALAAKIRVLCVVITHPANHNKKPPAIKATWGRKCTKLVFISSTNDASVPTVKVIDKEGREYLWGKLRGGLEYIYDKHRYEADWFLRTDDDAYIIMENLRYLLSHHDSWKPLYFGFRYKPFTPQGYMSGGAGVVLSREALERIVKNGLRGSMLCGQKIRGADDAELGICLHRIGVKAVDSRDSTERDRFWPFNPSYQMNLDFDRRHWYWRYTYYPVKHGIECCSDYTVSFHYIKPEEMYAMEFLIYRLRPYGIHYGMAQLPASALFEEEALPFVPSWQPSKQRDD